MWVCLRKEVILNFQWGRNEVWMWERNEMKWKIDMCQLWLDLNVINFKYNPWEMVNHSINSVLCICTVNASSLMGIDQSFNVQCRRVVQWWTRQCGICRHNRRCAWWWKNRCSFNFGASILKPKLNIFWFQFGKLLSVRHLVQLFRISYDLTVCRMGVAAKPTFKSRNL